MSTKLDLCWAQYIIDKYEEEFDCRVNKNEIDGILTKLMYEKDFVCDEKQYKLIIEELIENL